MNSSLIVRAVIAAALIPTLSAAATLERHIIVVGANNGGGDRPRLRYAISDAERFARVMTELGGVDTENATVLREPRVGDFLRALDNLKARLELARATRILSVHPHGGVSLLLRTRRREGIAARRGPLVVRDVAAAARRHEGRTCESPCSTRAPPVRSRA
jgi:hypothetical protein